jgi:hypothetical protein
MTHVARLTLAVSILALDAPLSTVSAQERVQVQRPDTLGANYDIARVGTGTPSDYDLLIGTWSYRFQARTPGGNGRYGPPRPGTWTFAKTHGGYVVDDEFSTQNPDGSRTLTVTYRVFNPEKKVWQVQGVGAKRGTWQPGVGWSDRTSRYLVQDYPEAGLKVRIKYYDITRDHFLWRADGSQDGGKTWVPDLWLIEATRVTP